MKHRFLCRVCSFFLSILLVFTVALSRPAALNVNAASLVLGEAATNEISMVLWNLLMNCLVACGVEASFGDYGMEVAFFTAYLNELSLSHDVDSNITFTLADGSRVALQQLIGDNTVGTGALQIPDEATWQRFRVIDGGGSSSPDNDPQFTQLVSFAMDAGVLLGISKFIEALQDGEIEGLDPADYFPDGFDGTLEQDAEGNYIVYGWLSGTGYNSSGLYPVFSRLSVYKSAIPVVGYYDTVVATSDISLGTIEFLGLSFAGTVKSVSVPAEVTYYLPNGVRTITSNNFSYHTDVGMCSLNIPIFSSRAAAVLFLQSGEFTGCENALQYDPAALPDALPDNFAPLTGTELDPSVFNALFPALVSALQTAFPQPQPNPDPDAEPEPVPLPDPVAGNAVFNQTVADTAADVASGAASKPDPDPDPQPDIDVDIGSYKADLTNIFPFCLPFDFIHLLQALDAEPVTPCFDFPFVVPALDMDITLQLDLSFLNEVMKIFRLCETVSFIVMLIFITPKLIRW